MFHVPNIAFVPCSTQNLIFVPCSPGINVIPLFPKTPGRDYVMWLSYLAICVPCRIKKRPIDGRSANKRMVERKLEMSTRSGSNYLTLAGKSRFQGALRSSFMSILVLQSSNLSSWYLVMVVWLFLVVPWVCRWFVIVVFSDQTH